VGPTCLFQTHTHLLMLAVHTRVCVSRRIKLVQEAWHIFFMKLYKRKEKTAHLVILKRVGQCGVREGYSSEKKKRSSSSEVQFR
jgi:hypothetical protein